METWSIEQAKAKFSELITLADSQGPQAIIQNGKTAAVVVSAKEWEHDLGVDVLPEHKQAKRSDNLADFFAASPLQGSDLELARSTDSSRAQDL